MKMSLYLNGVLERRLTCHRKMENLGCFRDLRDKTKRQSWEITCCGVLKRDHFRRECGLSPDGCAVYGKP